MSETCPFSNANAVFSNSGTIIPLPKKPRSPPLLFEPSIEYCFARFAKLSPFAILALSSCAKL